MSEAEAELERIKLRATARLVDNESDLRSSESRLTLEKEKLAKYEAQIAKGEIRAPVAGMVVYAQQDGGRWGNREPISEGTSVRERQKIITIPVTAGMIAEVSLHESVLEMVREGMRCSISVDALSDRQYSGTVRFKSVLPDQQSWFANPNQRVYRTVVAIDGDNPEMRPGMTCSVEVLVQDIADTLYVPLQAVFMNRGQRVCFVREPGEVSIREVEVGLNNHKFVQVLGGLEEGETVLLSQPPGFSLDPGVEPAEIPEAPEGEQSFGGASFSGGDRSGGGMSRDGGSWSGKGGGGKRGGSEGRGRGEE